MVKGIINAFDLMEFCLVLILTMGGKPAVAWPPNIATTLNTWARLFKTNDVVS